MHTLLIITTIHTHCNVNKNNYFVFLKILCYYIAHTPPQTKNIPKRMNSNHKTYAAPANSAKSDAETNKFIQPKKFAASGKIRKENHTISGCMASIVNCRQSKSNVKCLSTNPVKRPIGKKPNCRKRRPAASSVGAAKKKPNQTAALGRNASVSPSGLQHRYNKTGRSEQKQIRQSKAGAPSRGQVMEWNNNRLTPMSSFESDEDEDDDDHDDEEDEVDQDHQPPST